MTKKKVVKVSGFFNFRLFLTILTVSSYNVRYIWFNCLPWFLWFYWFLWFHWFLWLFVLLVYIWFNWFFGFLVSLNCSVSTGFFGFFVFFVFVGFCGFFVLFGFFGFFDGPTKFPPLKINSGQILKLKFGKCFAAEVWLRLLS